MKQTDFTDKALEAAAADVRKQLLSAPDTQDANAFPFSEDFENRMDAALRKNRRKVNAMIGFKRAMAACLAIVLCMSAWLAVDVDAREAVIDWAKNLLNYGQANYDSFEYLPRENQLPELVAYYLPGEDYKEISREYDDDKCTVTYKGDAEDSLFSISYSIGPQIYSWTGSPFIFDSNSGTTKLTRGKDDYGLYTPHDSTQCKNLGFICHTDNFTSVEILIAYYFDHEIAVRIADHIMTREQAEELTLPIKYLTYVPERFGSFQVSYNNTDITYRYYDEGKPDGTIYKLALNYHIPGQRGAFYDQDRYAKGFTQTAVHIDGKEARLYTYNNGTLYSLLMWDDGQLEYELQFEGIDLETAIKMAESVQ